jgi:uncharacterized membrane protein
MTMMSTTIRNVALGASIGAGISGGVFFGFSTFVMRALGRLPTPQAIAAMQSINRYAPNPWFMTALLGTGAAAVPLAVSGLRHLDEPSSTALLIGSGLYLGGVVLTIAYHVPRNDALAAMDPTGAGAAQFWTRYLREWTAWNHVRTATSVGGAIAFLVAARGG